MPVAKQILKAGDDVAALQEKVAEKRECILKRLEDAKMEFDTYALKCLLQLAVQAGIPKEELDVFRAVFKDCHKQEFVQAKLEFLVEACHLHEQGDVELTRSEKRLLVKRANNLIKMGKRLGMSMSQDSVLLEASNCLRKMVPKCLRENIQLQPQGQQAPCPRSTEKNEEKTEAARSAILTALDHAKLDLDTWALKHLLQLAVQAGIVQGNQGKTILEPYRQVFKDLHSKEFVEAELEKMANLDWENLSADEKIFFLQRWSNLVRIGNVMGLATAVSATQ